MPSTARRFVYEHAFLPPKLPQSDHREEGADFLLKELYEATREFWRSMPVGTSDARVLEQLMEREREREREVEVKVTDGG